MVGDWFTVNQNTVAIKDNEWQIFSHDISCNLVEFFLSYERYGPIASNSFPWSLIVNLYLIQCKAFNVG